MQHHDYYNVYVSPSSTPPGSGTRSIQEVSPEVGSILHKNHICKSFEDDLFFCPRVLLSAQEQARCQEIDSLFTQALPLEMASPSMNYNETAYLRASTPGKFNPYKSQSFNPSEH
ncbi:Uncharacterized protein RNJ44_02529 [Nakaseomyces bracarensis]|uniref:Uncharacterized protein n=1 Tax=Nakaseomyces bracarensis TaxID=273131 RepID=A0ABR4NLY8_9SACH